MSQYIHNPEETKELLPRFRMLYLAVIVMVLLFSVRLWILQVVQGTELREFSEKNRIKQIKVAAPRGLVLDAEGRILVENKPGFEAVLNPQYITKIEDIAAAVGPLIDVEPAKVIQRIQKSRRQNGPYAPIRLKENLSREEVFRLKRIRLDTPGLEIRETVVRSYPLKADGAQLLGYVGEISKKQIPLYNELYKGIDFEQGDIVGKSGIEEVLERDIRGDSGTEYVQVDAYGRETATQTPNVYGEEIKDRPSVQGANVVLTIDRDLQEAGWNSFVTQQNLIGGVIAMKADGEILAWFNAPSYDPNEFAQGVTPQIWSKLINDPFKPLRNKVIQDHFAPGSTFKPYMASAALQEKVITPTTLINCPGSLRFGNRDYHDHQRNGEGTITVLEALERSSNVFFYKMGIALGIDRMYNYISMMGLGAKTGIEIPREVSGLMPSAAWKKQALGEEWQPGENLSNAIGQGFVQVTPIQMAVGYMAIGLEGKVVKPFVIKKVVDVDGKVIRETKEQLIRDLSQVQPNGVHFDNSTFKTVKEGLRLVVNGPRGTARGSVRLPGIEIAGKTGTAQVRSFAASDIYSKCENRPLMQRHNGWFVGFAPVDKPEIVVAALGEHACHGTAAGHTVRAIMAAYFNKHHPEWMVEGPGSKTAAPLPPPLEGE